MGDQEEVEQSLQKLGHEKESGRKRKWKEYVEGKVWMDGEEMYRG